MKDNDWNLIRAIHADKTGVPPVVVDYIAVEEILRNSVYGLSNMDISTNLDMDLEYIEATLKYFLEFGGWKDTLEVNPYFIFKASKDSKDFNSVMESIIELPIEDIKLAYIVCLRYNSIKELIDEFYS